LQPFYLGVRKLSRKQATGFALLAFATTLLISSIFPGQVIVLSGLLVVIFLSVFVKTRSSTIIAGVISFFCLAFHFLINPYSRHGEIWLHYGFILFLLVFTSAIVLYIKNLFERMELDKSHVTSLFENATEGFVVTNSKGDIVLVNPSACRMFGYDREELTGQKVELLIPSQYRHGHVKLRDGFYEHPRNRVMGHGRDLFGQKKDGHNFPVEVSLSTYNHQDERFVIAFIVDITHRKEIEKSIVDHQRKLEKVTGELRVLNQDLEMKVEERTAILKEALQKLEQSQAELHEALDKERQLNEIKSRFVSMASHEFRTPLSTVLSSASLLSKYTETSDQDKRDRHIQKIKASVKHLNDLLEDFLSLGKLDEGKIGANYSRFDLKGLITETAEEIQGLQKIDQKISLHHSGDSVVVSDKRLIRNILINLLTNAIKFSGEGAVIEVNSEVEGGKAVVSVADPGIGIASEDAEHLFSSFFRGSNAINIQGTGLGLHIVKRYLDLLHGSVGVSSALGKGTTIRFEIPVNQNADE